MKTILTIIAILGSVSYTIPAQEVFRNSEKIVLLGNTFIERAQATGFVEFAISTSFPDKDLTFRNLGWSGDTVYCPARSYFGPPKEGFQRLTKHIDEIKPTLIVVNYGAVAAFDGKAGLENFITGYKRLLDMLGKSGARIVLMSPPPMETLDPPLPEAGPHNARLKVYSEVIGELARERGLRFVDLFTALGAGTRADRRPALTENGLHFTPVGYRHVAKTILSILRPDAPPPTIELEARNGKCEGEASVNRLPLPPPPGGPESAAEPVRVTVSGLAPGNHALLIDGNHIATAAAATWENGIDVTLGPDAERAAELVNVIRKKNQLFFHRWRPQNETYLFGFRKHEQGNNAVEIPQFDPLIEAEEKRIAKLRRPMPRRYELKPVPES